MGCYLSVEGSSQIISLLTLQSLDLNEEAYALWTETFDFSSLYLADWLLGLTLLARLGYKNDFEFLYERFMENENIDKDTSTDTAL